MNAKALWIVLLVVGGGCAHRMHTQVKEEICQAPKSTELPPKFLHLGDLVAVTPEGDRTELHKAYYAALVAKKGRDLSGHFIKTLEERQKNLPEGDMRALVNANRLVEMKRKHFSFANDYVVKKKEIAYILNSDCAFELVDLHLERFQTPILDPLPCMPKAWALEEAAREYQFLQELYQIKQDQVVEAQKMVERGKMHPDDAITFEIEALFADVKRAQGFVDVKLATHELSCAMGCSVELLIEVAPFPKEKVMAEKVKTMTDKMQTPEFKDNTKTYDEKEFDAKGRILLPQ